MDLNVIIIQNVKNFPELYNRNRKLAEREKTWKFLAKSLKLDEIFLKSRWHILRERYVKQLQNELDGQQRNYFKYAKELEFIKQHIKLRAPTSSQLEGNIPHNWINPEFVITAAELEFQTENLQECKEIMFMEIEEQPEESSKEIVENRTEVEESCLEVVEEDASQELEDVEDNCNRMIEDECQEIEEKCNKVLETSEIEYISNEVEGNCNEVDDSCQEIENECNKVIKNNHYKVQETKEMQKSAIAKKREASLDQAKEITEAQTQRESPKLSTVKIEESDEHKLTIAQNSAQVILEQEEPPAKKVIVEKIDKQDTIQNPVEIQTTIRSDESSTRTDTAAIQKPESPAKNIRCEDAIFGELIVAMLKSMDPVKKKSIKREIMNLLFS